MTTIQVSRASQLFAEISGDKSSDAGVHTKTSDVAGMFQSILADMQQPTVPSKETFSETEANQVLLDSEGKERVENSLPDYVQTTVSILNVRTKETLILDETLLESDASLIQSEPSDLVNKSVTAPQTTASIPLFAMRTQFEGGDGRKFITNSSPILSTKQLESLAKWSVTKSGDTKVLDDKNLRTVLGSDLSPVLDSESSPILETDLSPVLETDLSPVLETDLSPVLKTETSLILENKTSPVLKPAALEPTLTVPLQAPELPVEFQQDGVESLDVTKPEFEKFRFEFARNMTVPLRQTINDGGQTLRIQVFPENLGHIDIVVSMQDGKMHAQLTASSTVTKEVLEMQLPQLRQSLQEQGIQLDQLDVDLFGDEGFERERPNYQPGAEQNSSQTDGHTNWSDEIENQKTVNEEKSQAVDYSV